MILNFIKGTSIGWCLMPYEKLIIAATSSGQELGKKVCKSLDKIVADEFIKLGVSERYQIPTWDVLKQKRFDDLTVLRAFNRREFGDERFHLWPIERINFASTEFKIVIGESVRGADVYLLHNSFEPYTLSFQIGHTLMKFIKEHENLFDDSKAQSEFIAILEKWHAERSVAENDMELLFTISALKQDACAKKVTVFNPQLSNQRQDYRRKREGINVRDFIHFVAESGADELIMFDVHSISTLACSRDIKLDNIFPTQDMIRAFINEFPDYKDTFVIVAPDAGAAKKCEHFSKKLGVPVYIASKVRDYEGVNKVNKVILPYPRELLDGKYALVIDDMVDTAGTLIKVHKACKDMGMKGTAVIVTHFLANYNQKERLNPIHEFDKMYKKGELLYVFTTDTITRPSTFAEKHRWYKEISQAPSIAQIIFSMHFRESVKKAHLDEA